MTKKQKFKEVCDEWTQHALCPAGDTCAKLYGREAMKHVCSLHLYKGKCHMASEIGHKSHPPQPQIIGTPYLKGLDLKRERQVALECLVNEVSAGGLDAQQSRDVASYSWVKGTTKQIAVPGTCDHNARHEIPLITFKVCLGSLILPTGLKTSSRTEKTRRSI